MTFFGTRHAAVDSHAAHMNDELGAAAATHDPHHHDDHAHGHDDHGHHAPHESPLVMLVPLGVLATGALLAGIVFAGPFIGHAYDEFWKGSLFTGGDNHLLHEMHEVPFIAVYGATIMMVLGFLASLYVYVIAPGTAQRIAAQNPILYKFLLNKWYFDELYDFIFVRPAFWLGRLFWKGGDGRIIDGLGPDGISARVIDVTNRVVKLQTGFVYHYAFAMLIGVAAIITWYLVGGVH
jgi:NADH-quinone oxidoreductase subunit L